MTFLAHTDALIIDLRGAGEGAASMVNLLSSFFFEEVVHLNTIRGRPYEPEHQNWTSVQVCGPRYLEPVYVLTGETTGAAQDFACSLQALGRVTVVGEPVTGSVPLVAVGRLDPLFDVLIPVRRPVHPRSGEPMAGADADIAVPADRALEAACAAARQRRGDTAEPAP